MGGCFVAPPGEGGELSTHGGISSASTSVRNEPEVSSSSSSERT